MLSMRWPSCFSLDMQVGSTGLMSKPVTAAEMLSVNDALIAMHLRYFVVDPLYRFSFARDSASCKLLSRSSRIAASALWDAVGCSSVCFSQEQVVALSGTVLNSSTILLVNILSNLQSFFLPTMGFGCTSSFFSSRCTLSA